MIEITSNIEDVVAQFKALNEQLKTIDLSDALVVGVNAARGQMSFRIFNKGLDTGGTSLGSYKKNISKEDFLEGGFDLGTFLSPYEKKRRKAGRQIKYKDLEFTGTLRRGILVIKESQVRVVCAIPNEKLRKIATYQEEYIGSKIFGLSEEETELLKTNVIAAVTQIYDRLFNTKQPV